METVKGKIVSGKGHFQEAPEDLHTLYKNHSGLELVKGSLNIELPFEYYMKKPDKTFLWNGKEIYLKKCKIESNGNSCFAFIVRNDTDRTHPYNIIELISNTHFKDEWGLENGTEVKIHIIC